MSGAARPYRVITAHGPKEVRADGGYVLPHEHVLCDLRVWWDGEGPWDALDEPGQAVGPEMLDALRHRPQGILRENLVLSDWFLAASELRFACETGCQLVVDLTVNGLSPVPHLARRAADLAGLDLVVGVGNYLDPALRPEEREDAVEVLEERWAASLEGGVDGCAVGIIGEIGTSERITAAERRSLQAAARVQRRSGLPMNVHLHPYARRGLEVTDVLEEAGADLRRVAYSHCDGEIDVEWLDALLRRGAYVEFDLFGTGPDWEIAGRGFASDSERVDAVVELCERGHLERLLLSHDICMRNSLRRFGGWGYAHLAERVFEELDRRVGEEARRRLTCVNPLELLHVGDR